jgi:hypothetical protein
MIQCFKMKCLRKTAGQANGEGAKSKRENSLTANICFVCIFQLKAT